MKIIHEDEQIKLGNKTSTSFKKNKEEIMQDKGITKKLCEGGCEPGGVKCQPGHCIEIIA